MAQARCVITRLISKVCVRLVDHTFISCGLLFPCERSFPHVSDYSLRVYHPSLCVMIHPKCAVIHFMGVSKAFWSRRFRLFLPELLIILASVSQRLSCCLKGLLMGPKMKRHDEKLDTFSRVTKIGNWGTKSTAKRLNEICRPIWMLTFN